MDVRITNLDKIRNVYIRGSFSITNIAEKVREKICREKKITKDSQEDEVKYYYKGTGK